MAGVWKGWQTIKRNLSEPTNPKSNETLRIVSATLAETASLQDLTASNRDLAEVNRGLDRSVEDLVVTMRENREATRTNTEELHRVRLKVADLYELLREMRR